MRARMSDAEKRQRRNQRKADRINAKAAKQAGPLFAAQVERVTADDMHRLALRNAARAAEHSCTLLLGRVLLDSIREAVIRRHVRAVVGPEAFAKLDAYRWRTLGPEHGYGFWRCVLTGRIDASAAARPFRLDSADWPPVVGWVPPLTAAQYHALFPFPDEPPADHPEPVNPLNL